MLLECVQHFVQVCNRESARICVTLFNVYSPGPCLLLVHVCLLRAPSFHLSRLFPCSRASDRRATVVLLLRNGPDGFVVENEQDRRREEEKEKMEARARAS